MKNLLKIVLVLSLSMLYIPVFAMQPTSQAAGKYGIEYAKLISKSFTAVHWGISTGPFIGKGLASVVLAAFDKKICDLASNCDSGITGYEIDFNGNKKPIFRNKQFRCVDESIQEFADEQVKKVGLNKMPSVRVMPSGRSVASAAHNIVLITNQYNKILKKALETKNEKEINKAAGILQHEYTHIKNKDMLTHGVECLATPFLTHQLTKKVSIILPFAQKATPFWLQQGLKLFSAMGKYTLNSAILSGLSRRKEQRADNGICDDIETLQAVSDFFVEVEKRNADAPKSYLKEKYPKLNHYLFASHPSLDDRVIRLNKRIEKLKNETHF